MPSARSWYDQGRECERAGDLAGALEAYRRSLKLNPRVAAPWVGLAEVLDRNQQPRDALECLKRGAAAEPQNAAVATRLARSFHLLGALTEARGAYDRALRIEPRKTNALLGLAELCEDEGDPGDAAALYRRVLEIEPGHAEALGAIVGLGRDVDVSVEIDAARSAMLSGDDRRRAAIGYGLGRALERLGRDDDAFDVLAAANAARRAEAGAFQPDANTERVDGLVDIFTPAFFAARAGWGASSATPVFVVGLPRSGTTLTEQIIGSHPDCFGAGELPILTDLATGAPDRLDREDPPWPECAPDLSRAHIDALGQDYIARVMKSAPTAVSRIVDKQPLNFWHLGLVAIALPKAKIIHCVRDIRDNGFSIFAQNFSPQQRWATDLGDIAHYWRNYRRLMDHWKSATGLDILDVAYENTVSDLEAQARRLLAFLDLPWDPRVLDFHRNDRSVQTPSKWQVRRPLYSTSKAKWRRFERRIGPLIDAAEEAG